MPLDGDGLQSQIAVMFVPDELLRPVRGRSGVSIGSRHCWLFVVVWDTAEGGSVGTVLKSVAAQHVLSDVLFL